MSRSDCFDVLKNEAGDQFDRSELEDIFDKLQDEKSQAQIKKESAFDRLQKLGENISDEKEFQEAQKAFEFYRNLENQKEDLKLVRRFKNKRSGLKLSYLSIINGTQRGVEGARDSVRNKYLLLRSKIIDPFYTAIREGKVLPIYNSREYESQIAQEIIGEGQTGTEQEPAVRSIGAAARSALEKSKQLYNKNGIFFQDNAERISRNFHDRSKLLRTADTYRERIKDRFTLSPQEQFDKAQKRWREFTEPLLDPKKVKVGRRTLFELNDAETDRFYKEAFRTLTQNEKLTPEGDPLRVRIRKSRVLIWKDAASMVEYNRKMGTGSLQSALEKEFDISARQNAILEKMGQTPFKYLDNITKIVRDDPDLNMSLSTADKWSVRNTLKAAIGNDQGDATIAAIGGNLRRATDISKLGSVVVNSLADIVPVSLETARFHGGMLASTGESINNFIKAKQLRETETLGTFLQTFANNEIGNLHRFFERDVDLGLMSKLHSLTFKLNGLDGWDKGWRTSIASQSAHHLAVNKNVSFKQMIDRDKKFGEQNVRIFKAYNITEDEWDALRKVPTKLADNKEYILPESAQEIPDKDIKDIIKKERKIPDLRITKSMIEDRRQNIADKFATYFIDRTDHGIFSPDFNDQAMLLQGTSSGTVLGEMVRFMAQYKMYPLMYMKRSWGRAIYGGGADSFAEGLLTGKGDRVALAQLMTYGALMGYMSLAAGALILGKTPPDPFKPKTIMDSWIKGGALPLYGDYIFKPAGGYNDSLADNLTGPVLREFTDFLKLAQAPFTSSKPTHAAWQIAKGEVRPMIPWFMKYTMDALIFNNIDDMTSPGSTQKKINQLKKNGQSYLLPAKL